MTKIYCLLALCLTAVAGLPVQERIVNGSFTTINQYPSLGAVMLSLDYVNFRHICGGTIINNRSLLSAAHCFYFADARQVRVRVGSTFGNSGGNVHLTSLIINYPAYDPTMSIHDIGILRVSTAFSIGAGNIQVGSIAGPNYYPGDNQVVWAAGWGLTAPNGSASEQLRHVQIQTVSQSTCVQTYGSFLQPRIMICAGGSGRGVCSGDSGGPLYHNNVVVGVTSATAVPCATPPAIFARVSYYSNWIQTNA